MRSSRLFAALLLALSTVATASPNPTVAVKRDILPRQTSTPTGRPTAGSGTGVRGSEAADPNAPKESGTDKASGSGKNTNASTTKKVSIPVTAQVGRITMVTPAPSDGYQMYKVGDILTFAWNYTDVVVPPAAINVVAFCQDNSNDFTIAGNISAQATKVTWDTGDYDASATVKLLTASYTLNIFDAAKQKNSAPTAGYLSTFNGFQFGLYHPRPYKPLSEFVCPTCDPNTASTINKYTLRMSIGMCLLAVASFTWFLAGNQ